MDASRKIRRPGDIILDRYMANASEVEREEARENLIALIDVFIRMAEEELSEAKQLDSPSSGP